MRFEIDDIIPTSFYGSTATKDCTSSTLPGTLGNTTLVSDELFTGSNLIHDRRTMR